ncbi:NUDIX hydrolase [Paenibacillus antri]|uniref:NUDIX hydrolase n=1 Tax=Paenibacillus antri TaxID=2582848 RepID=A0A5R9GF45_9BACL|nr:NUDIX hydrolase [Paenibacillus antri]TLS51988.1 NUDIX hydrolase [Paenibacillus antri]
MTRDENWTVLGSRRTRYRFFEIVQEEVKTFQGRTVEMEYARMPEGVCVLPLLDGGRAVACIRQYRHAIRSWQWELPAGGVDAGVEPLEMAKRELEEETGYSAAAWTSLGSFYPSFGSTDQLIHLFVAEGLRSGQQRLEAGEELDVVEVPMETFREMVASGELRHGAALACVARWWAMGSGK